MNIKTVENDLSRALQLAAAGKNLEAARLFFAVVRMATQCRAKRRDAVRYTAAEGLARAIKRIYDNSKDPAERSEAGRIKAEARAFYNSK